LAWSSNKETKKQKQKQKQNKKQHKTIVQSILGQAKQNNEF